MPFGQIIESATADVTAQIPSAGTRLRRFVVTTELTKPALLRVGSIAIGVGQRIGVPSPGLRKIPLPHRSARGGSWGPNEAPVATLFVGCVADAWFSDIHMATIEVLLAAGYRVDAPASQTCCGALAVHDGFPRDAEAMSARNRDALRDADGIVVNVAGCGAHLKTDPEFGHKVRDVTEIVAVAIEDERLPRLPDNGEHVAVQDPCHLEHGQGIISEPRLVLRAAGYEVRDVDPGGLCCGAAGTYLIDHPDTSAELGRRKAAAVNVTYATLVASANAGCEMQLRRYLDDSHEIRHPIELYARNLSSSQSDE